MIDLLSEKDEKKAEQVENQPFFSYLYLFCFKGRSSFFGRFFGIFRRLTEKKKRVK